ncbi:isocitrate/isopropylmalate family dehydrogenase [Streptomyces sp. NPDC001705]
MDARQLQYFLAIVEHGGFSKSAAALHVAQPSLSQAMANLQADLGVPLFHRVGRGVVLSKAGTELLEPSRRVLRDLQAVRDRAASLTGLGSGTVDVAAMPSPGVEPSHRRRSRRQNRQRSRRSRPSCAGRSGRGFRRSLRLRLARVPVRLRRLPAHRQNIDDDGLDRLKNFDAIYFGAVGWPTVPDHISLWGLRLKVCQNFDQWANVRPVRFLPGVTSPLRKADDTELDWVVVRENSEGEYAGPGGRTVSGRGKGR